MPTKYHTHTTSRPLHPRLNSQLYNLPYIHDVVFGSSGLAKIIKMSRGWPSPPSKPNFTMEAIQWARMAVKKNLNTTTVIVCHHKAHHLTTIHDEMHIITTIPPHNIEYDPIFKWPKYLHQYDNIYTSILCIHNQRTLTKESTNNQQSHTTY